MQGRKSRCEDLAVNARARGAARITSGPVFWAVSRWGRIGDGLTGRRIAEVVQRAARRVGLDPRELAAHSLRAGFATTGPEPSKPSKAEPTPRPTKPAVPEWLTAEEMEQEQERKRSPQLQEADAGAKASQTVQRSIGRPGAPRWGALAPTPAKVRRVSRLQPNRKKPRPGGGRDGVLTVSNCHKPPGDPCLR
jgi:hypothetical protein